jgi:hypothetical protein
MTPTSSLRVETKNSFLPIPGSLVIKVNQVPKALISLPPETKSSWKKKFSRNKLPLKVQVEN